MGRLRGVGRLAVEPGWYSGAVRPGTPDVRRENVEARGQAAGFGGVGGPGYFFGGAVNSLSISSSVSLSLPPLASITSAVPLGAIQTGWLPSRKTSFIFGCFSKMRK